MERTHNLFVFDDRDDAVFPKVLPASWTTTIQHCFILKKESPIHPGAFNQETGLAIYINKRKTAALAVVGLTLFVLAIAVAAIAALALFFPPVGAAVGGLVALSIVQLGVIGGSALLLGLIGLTFGAAAARTLHQAVIDRRAAICINQ